MADPMLPYISLLSIAVTSGLLVMAILNEQQIYGRITEVRLRLQNTEEFTKMAAESHVYAERFALVDKPSEYYTIMAFLDLFEYVYHLKGENSIDDVVWNRWKALMETIMTIPKFVRVWEKTRYSHSDDQFKSFIDSILPVKNNTQATNSQ
jgi:hypothetical protein